jgi:hypothetical protein
MGTRFFQTGVRRRKYNLGSTKQFVPEIRGTNLYQKFVVFVPEIRGNNLLRLAEFIFPGPHPRLKELSPQVDLSYDQCTYMYMYMYMYMCVCVCVYIYNTNTHTHAHAHAHTHTHTHMTLPSNP